MSKIAQRYLDVDPWVVRETGFHPDRSLVSESIFSVGNEFMGVRGYFDEGYGGKTLLGSYFNGIFEEKPENNFFKGLIRRTHFLINAIDWLHTRISLDGEKLDLATSKFSGFIRTLDLRNGILRREFVWTTRKGKKLKLVFERFTSMRDMHLACQRITFEAMNFTGQVKVEMGLDAAIVSETHDRQNFFSENKSARTADGTIAILAKVDLSGHKVMSTMRLVSDTPIKYSVFKGDKFIGCSYRLSLEKGKDSRIDRIVVNSREKRAAVSMEKVWNRGLKIARDRKCVTWEESCTDHVCFWADSWKKLDVQIEGDAENQQGVRFSIFQLNQTYHGADPDNNVTAKGLTGEAYWGLTWWDTETYCLPFYIFNNPDAARNLLLYRHSRLPQACERARQKDCEGARYPMSTIDGTEACGTWQHGDLEIHVSAAVGYGIWHYFNVTGDRAFMYSEGIEMLLQISRYYASRGQWSPLTGEFGFWFVMGPDEFHMGVNNNCYTNVMAKKCFEWTLAIVDEIKRREPELLKSVFKKVAIRPGEIADWKRKAQKMRILQDKHNGVYEQHDGYFDAPHIDCSKIPVTDFPIYHHWAYFKIFRWDMIKQPDVLLLHFFFSHEHSLKNKKSNYDYYEPRCSHESSLSPGVHSILAAELGRHDKAYKYWGHAARLDLDDFNRNTEEGLHTTSMAAAWLNVIYGFGGMRSDGRMLDFNPSLPSKWRSFSFRIMYRGSVLNVCINQAEIRMSVDEGAPAKVAIFGREHLVTKDGISVPIPGDRIAKMNKL